MKIRNFLLLSTIVMSPVYADVLDFSGNICTTDAQGLGATGSCSNNERISQSYGDTANVSITYVDVNNPANTLVWYGPNYNDLNDVLYAAGGDGAGQSWGRIEIRPLNGLTVTLNSFDLGAWPSTTRNSNVRILELDTNSVLTDYGTVSIGVGSTTHNSFSPGDSSSKGIAIEWKDTAYNVGIDNVNFDLTTGGTVPEPSSIVLMSGGLIAFAVRRMRRS